MVLLADQIMDLRRVELWSIKISQSVVVAPAMKPDIIVAVDHDAAPIGVELHVALHPPMSRQIVPEADEYTFAKFTLKDRCPPGCPSVAQLMHAAFGPTAVATLAFAPPVKLVQDVLAVAHKAPPIKFTFMGIEKSCDSIMCEI